MHSSSDVWLPVRFQSPLACILLCSHGTWGRVVPYVPLTAHLWQGPVGTLAYLGSSWQYFPMARSVACARFLWVAPTGLSPVQGEAGACCSGSHSPGFLVAWSETCASCFNSPLLSIEPLLVALCHSDRAPLSSGVRWALGCSEWPWQDCPRCCGGVGMGCSGLHNQSSPVVCSGLLRVASTAGPGAGGGAGAVGSGSG